jgi:transposase InsO family protein
VDLCFVPASHEAEVKLPAVSGSSGRLVIEQPAAAEEQRQYPGRIFEDASLDYTEAMVGFAAASLERKTPSEEPMAVEEPTQTTLKAQKRALSQEKAELRRQRRQTRQRRQQEDAAWIALRQERRTQQVERRSQSKAEPVANRNQRQAQDRQWQQLRQQRQQQLQQRMDEDTQWRRQRQGLRQRLSDLPIVTAWIAILVITDNCTRQCLGLPLFVAGPRVTAEFIAEALQALLPPDLLFLISDRGVHFKAQAFRQLIRSEEFIHVLIARHRPQSNGIAERFVRTLKEWLADKSWNTDEELAELLARFIAHYNDRPHQGLAIPGLSPHEFANRIWLM